MTDDTKQLEVENALLRGGLWLTAKSLKDYHDAPHEPIDVDGVPMVQVTVSEVIRGKAHEAIERADKMLRGEQ